MATVYETVTERIIKALEKGVVPWNKPWTGQNPSNLVSKKAYRGINHILLSISTEYESPWWLTFKQAKALGGSVRKGEKGTPIVFWKPISRVVKNEEGEEKTERGMILRQYTVFNSEQCDLTEGTVPETENYINHDPIAAGESVVTGMPNSPAISQGGDRAFYRPDTDEIRVPAITQYQDAAEYYRTLFHELGHSTGHESRLDRKDAFGGGFGSESYAREELLAEIAATFLMNEAEISHEVQASASYIDSWLKVLKSDTRAIVLAAGRAQKAADFILDRKLVASEA